MIQLLMRAAGLQKRGRRSLRWAEGPQKASAGAIMVARKGPCFLFPWPPQYPVHARRLSRRGTIAQMLRPLGVVIAGPLGDYLEFDFYPNNIDWI